MRPAWLYRSGLDLVDRSPAFSWRRSLCPPCSGRWLSHTTEHGCAGVDVKSMARKGVNCRRPPPSLTRVINDRRIVKKGGSGRQVHDGSRCTSWSVLSSGWRSRRRPGRSDRRLARRERGDLWAGTSTVFVSKAPRKMGRSFPPPRPSLAILRAHPADLPRRVMTTHPAAVDAGLTTANGGSVESRKYRICGHAA